MGRWSYFSAPASSAESLKQFHSYLHYCSHSGMILSMSSTILLLIVKSQKEIKLAKWASILRSKYCGVATILSMSSTILLLIVKSQKEIKLAKWASILWSSYAAGTKSLSVLHNPKEARAKKLQQNVYCKFSLHFRCIVNYAEAFKAT